MKEPVSCEKLYCCRNTDKTQNSATKNNESAHKEANSEQDNTKSQPDKTTTDKNTTDTKASPVMGTETPQEGKSDTKTPPVMRTELYIPLLCYKNIGESTPGLYTSNLTTTVNQANKETKRTSPQPSDSTDANKNNEIKKAEKSSKSKTEEEKAQNSDMQKKKTVKFADDEGEDLLYLGKFSFEVCQRDNFFEDEIFVDVRENFHSAVKKVLQKFNKSVSNSVMENLNRYRSLRSFNMTSENQAVNVIEDDVCYKVRSKNKNKISSQEIIKF